MAVIIHVIGAKHSNSPDKLRHTRSVAYSVELVVLNKHHFSGGGAYLDKLIVTTQNITF